MTHPVLDDVRQAPLSVLVARMRALARRRLATMFRPDEGLFVFRLRLDDSRLVAEGVSPRYTAITLIALAHEDRSTCSEILQGHRLTDVVRRLLAAGEQTGNLGDAALACWAAIEIGACDSRAVWQRLIAMEPERRPCTTVELAWTLTALSIDAGEGHAAFRERVAQRLMSLYHTRARTFSHDTGSARHVRSHVACFADQIYPIHALAEYVAVTGDSRARHIAESTADNLCVRQGPAGQWWWHYDTRTGDIVERYPVYTVHQDGMAPMAFTALQRVSRLDFSDSVTKGVTWLASSPEIGGSSLIDTPNDVIWRKVARREPGKTSRYLQAAATRMRAGAAWPGLDRLFPAGAIDFECRPYHLAWLLYAWRGPAADVTDRR